MPHPSSLLSRSDAVLLVVDVQERINAVMVDQAHLPVVVIGEYHWDGEVFPKESTV